MQYRYVIVELRDGGSWHLFGDKDRPTEVAYSPDELCALPDLLNAGWTPVRETPGGAANIGMLRNDAQSYCLVLLSKEDEPN